MSLRAGLCKSFRANGACSRPLRTNSEHVTAVASSTSWQHGLTVVDIDRIGIDSLHFLRGSACDGDDGVFTCFRLRHVMSGLDIAETAGILTIGPLEAAICRGPKADAFHLGRPGVIAWHDSSAACRGFTCRGENLEIYMIPITCRVCIFRVEEERSNLAYAGPMFFAGAAEPCGW